MSHPGYDGHLGAMRCTKKDTLNGEGVATGWRIALESEGAGDPPQEGATAAVLSILTSDPYLERVFAVGGVYALEIGTWPGHVVAHARSM